MNLRDVVKCWLKDIKSKNMHLKNLKIDPIVSHGYGRIKYLGYYIAYIENEAITLVSRNFKHLVIHASDPGFFSKLLQAIKRRILEIDELNDRFNK